DRWGSYDDEDAHDLMIGGRYLDAMAKRGNEWRIIERLVVFDYFREVGDTGNWQKSQTLSDSWTPGARSPDDPASTCVATRRRRGAPGRARRRRPGFIVWGRGRAGTPVLVLGAAPPGRPPGGAGCGPRSWWRAVPRPAPRETPTRVSAPAITGGHMQPGWY